MNTTQLLSSQVPEIVLLALLSNYEVERTEAVLRLIVMQLKAVSKSETELLKYLKQLVILSRLRTIESLTIKIIEEMPITYDIEKDALYKRGHEQGKEAGIKQGFEKALLTVVINCLKQGKGYEETAILTGLTIAQVKEIVKNIKKD